jgi:hypothetical protein
MLFREDKVRIFVDYRVVVTSESLQLSYERDGVQLHQYRMRSDESNTFPVKSDSD